MGNESKIDSFVKQTASDYDVRPSIANSIWKKCAGNKGKFYEEMEKYIDNRSKKNNIDDTSFKSE